MTSIKPPAGYPSPDDKAVRPRHRDRADIRTTFDQVADSALLDDDQVAELAGVSSVSVKRWRRLGRMPPVIRLHGYLPRHRAGLIRQWLLGATSPSE